jgi:hypothetical protein
MHADVGGCWHSQKSDVEAVLKTYHTMSQHLLMLHPLSSMLDAMPQVGDFLLEYIH